MKKIVVLSVFFLLAYTAFGQNWFKGTLDEAMAKAKTENKKVLVDFFSGG